MMYPYPFFGSPNFRKPYHYYPYKIPNNSNLNLQKNVQKPYFPNIKDKKIEENCSSSSKKVLNNDFCINNVKDSSDNFDTSNECFEIFGLKLYFDDLLIIALLFFLYQEDVKDTYLYIALILLLLS